MNGIINNTNSIQITGIHALPFIEPNNETKLKVEKLVKDILKNKEKDSDYNYNPEQKQIDEIIYNFYRSKFNFKDKLKEKLDKEFSIYSN